MGSKRTSLVLGALVIAWAAIATPGLVEQFAHSGDITARLAGKSLAERSRLVDSPAYLLGETLGRLIPENGCVTVLAYAGPAAVDYYNARLDYLLYPRRVQAFADSSANEDGCGYVAVFRDTAQNLAAEPFAGQWDSARLEERLAAYERVSSDQLVRLYKVR